MTTIDFACPSCHATIHAPARLAGRKIKCPHCTKIAAVPRHDSVSGAARGEAHSSDAAGRVPIAILAAAGVAVVGAAVWALIAYLTEYEIGWIAWGIGAGAGGAAVAVGGRGAPVAVSAAVLSLVAIFGGKYAAVYSSLPHFGREALRAEVFTSSHYDTVKEDAAAFAALGADPVDAQLRAFMVDHGFTEAGNPQEIDPEELKVFVAEQAPELREFQRDQPEFSVWQALMVERYLPRMLVEMRSHIIPAIREQLSGFDLLWIFLGVTSSFGLVMRVTKQEAAERQQAAFAQAREARQAQQATAAPVDQLESPDETSDERPLAT